MDGRGESWQAFARRSTNGKLDSFSGRIFGRARAVSPLWWVKGIPHWRMNCDVEMLLVTSNDTGRSVALASVKWVGVEAALYPPLPVIMQFFPSWEVTSMGGSAFTPVSHSTNSCDRCKKTSHGIKGIEKTFTWHDHIFCHEFLFSGFELSLLNYH